MNVLLEIYQAWTRTVFYFYKVCLKKKSFVGSEHRNSLFPKFLKMRLCFKLTDIFLI